MEKKRLVTFVLGCSFLVLAIFFMLAFINNCSVSYQWHRDAFNGQMKVDEQKTVNEYGRNSTEVRKTKTYKGCIPFMDWTCFDMTTVSTLVPFVGFAFISLGFFLIVKMSNKKRVETIGKSATIIPKHFPFFEDYDRIMVILGLSGTFWGIIMIGYYPPGEIDMPALMLCLHTALYSTLVSVLWVFGVARPIRGLMQRWFVKVTGIETRGDADVADLFRELGGSVSGATADFRSASTTIAGLQKQVEGLKEEFNSIIAVLATFKQQTGVDVFGAVQSSIKDLRDLHNKSVETLAAIQKTADSNKDFIQKQTDLMTKMCKALEFSKQTIIDEIALRTKAEKRVAELEAENKRMATWIDRMKAFFNGKEL